MRIVKRSKHNLSHENKLTCDMGYLIPVMCKLALPGDKWKVKINLSMRVAPLLAPMMHNVKVYFHTFSVPLRLLVGNDNWENFITGGVNGDDTSVLPRISFSEGINVGDLGDYLGFPTNEPQVTDSGGNIIKQGRTFSQNVSALPFRAYALIYNDWYRNQNTDNDGLPIGDNMGVDTTTNTTLQRRNWRKDYFTQGLPWQIRGPQVVIPTLGTSAPVYGETEKTINLSTYYNNQYFSKAGMLATELNRDGNVDTNLGISTESATNNKYPLNKTDFVSIGSQSNKGGWNIISKSSTHPTTVYADLSANDASTAFSDFMWANAVYNWSARQARGGARYVETLMSQFGVRSRDSRLQRPEFIGGSVSQLVVTPVLQTSSTDTVSPQGNMAGQAFTAQSSKQFSHFFDEHCVVMTLMSIMPATSYQQGTPREWMYRTRYDFPWPAFSHTAEQATYKGEIYTTGNDTVDYQTFNFNPRYEECRRCPDEVHGEFRTTLDYWHMGRIFDEAPVFNNSFVQSNPTKRINAVTSEDNCWCDIGFQISAYRPIPKNGNPSLKVSV